MAEKAIDITMAQGQKEEGSQSGALSVHAKATVDQESIGLGDLAGELRAHIMSMLDHPRDFAAACCASPLFVGANNINDVVLRWASRDGMYKLLESRAPLSLIASALHNDTLVTKPFLLFAAASGGRMDVVRLVHCEIEARGQGTRGLTPRDLTSAIDSALAEGHIDVARYLLSRPIDGARYNADYDTYLSLCAARSGRPTSMAYMHDRIALQSTGGQCACSDVLGSAAWKAPSPDAALWLKEHGCSGYVRPSARHVADAIARGHVHTLNAILVEISPFQCEPWISIDCALHDTCAAGNLPVVVAATRAGLVEHAATLYVGASTGGHTSILDHAKKLFGTPRDVLRAAAIAAARSPKSADAVRWIAAERPDVIDATIMFLAISNASVNVVRAIDRALGGSFDWQRAAQTVLKTNNVDMLRFAIEEKGVVIDATLIDEDVSFTALVAQYLLSHCGPDAARPIFDAVSVMTAVGSARDPSRWAWLESIKGGCMRERYAAEAFVSIHYPYYDGDDDDDNDGGDDNTGAEDTTGGDGIDHDVKVCNCCRCQREESPRPIKRQRTRHMPDDPIPSSSGGKGSDLGCPL